MMNLLKKASIFSALGILFLLISFVSCKNDDTDSGLGKARFEVTGDFTGTLSAIYSVSTFSNGDGQYQNLKTLPWLSEEFETNGHTSLSITVGNAGTNHVAGKPGQRISVKIYLNDKVVKTVNATADSDGFIGTGNVDYDE